MNIYIGNLHYNVNEEELKEIFKKYGEVKITTQGIKELLDSGVNLIINDSHTLEELQYMVKIATENEKNITIIAKKKGLEDLKKIASAAKNNLTIHLK